MYDNKIQQHEVLIINVNSTLYNKELLAYEELFSLRHAKSTWLW